MPTMILHFFDRNDPNGDTIFECSTDDRFVKQVKLKIERDSMGGGEVNFARKTGTGLISRDIVVPETLVRVVIPEIDSDKYLWGFFINPRQQQVVSAAEHGGEGFTFGGPGPKHYLSRAVLRGQSFTGIDDAVDDAGGVWVWSETASAGRIMSRLISEDAAATAPTTMLPDLTKTFSLTEDSDSVAWVDDISSNQDFSLNIGDDYLKLLWLLEDASGMITHIDLGSIGDPKLQLEAWQSKGRDLTGDLAADTVHFIEGVNIAADLNVEGQSFRKASHALVIGNDGQYTVAQRPGWSSGEFKRMITTSYPSSNDDVLEKMGQRFLNRQENGERQIDLRIVPGWDPENGLYMFGPPGTDGHFWLWDTVDLTTGQSSPTVLDYQAEPQSVTGIHVELEEAVRDDDALAAARSLNVKAILNKERASSNTSRDLAGNRGTVQSPPAFTRLCLPTIPPEDDVFVATRLYPDSGTPPISPAFSAIWDRFAGTGRRLLSTTPGGGSGTGAVTWSNTGVNGEDVRSLQFLWPLPGTGTLDGWFRSFGQVKSRSGVGINENSQSMVGQCEVKVVSSDGSTVRGVAYAGHSLATPGTNLEWPPFTSDNEPASSRAMPPLSEWDDPALGVALTPVNWSVGDYLVIEVGIRNFGTAVTGSAYYNHYDAASDMPETEGITTSLRTWFEIISIEAGSGGEGTIRSGHPDLVGTAHRASRCDHQHHVKREVAPTPIDDEAHGYPAGTLWHVVDDEDAPTTITASYISLQDDTGAAEWFLFPWPSAEEDVGIAIEDPVEGDVLRYSEEAGAFIDSALRWEPVTTNPGGGPEVVFDGDDIVMTWADYS